MSSSLDCSDPLRPTVLAHLTLRLPPACIEFAPDGVEAQRENGLELKRSRYCVVGLYALVSDGGTADEPKDGGGRDDDNGTSDEKKPQIREGGLEVYRVDVQPNGADDLNVVKVQSFPQNCGILDLHFSPFSPRRYSSEASILATATSAGTIGIFSFDPRCESPLTLLSEHLVAPNSNILSLALAWSPQDPWVLGTTLSDGQTLVCRFDAARKHEGDSKPEWKLIDTTPSPYLHSLEVWTLAFSTQPPGLLSGADDCTLAFIDKDNSTRFPTDSATAEGDTVSPLSGQDDDTDRPYRPLTNSNVHEAGVTAILPLLVGNQSQEQTDGLVLTGSYDERVRLLRLRSSHSWPMMSLTGQLLRPVDVLAEKALDGGVWRLKLISIDCQQKDSENRSGAVVTVLASCMHAGVRVIQVFSTETDKWDIRVLGRLDHIHKSMNYGSDFWQLDDADVELSADPNPMRGSAKVQQGMFASTSFYDKVLCFWKLRESKSTVASA